MVSPVAFDLLRACENPLADPLRTANQDDIESVILIGGSSRVPMVQAAVAAVVGEEKIAKNVNADEAAVLGSFSSSRFRVFFCGS
jgi:hypoxia up-regulated 1